MSDYEIGIRIKATAPGVATVTEATARDLGKIDAAAQKVSASTKQATRSIDDAKRSLSSVSSVASIAHQALAGIGAALTVRGILQQADNYATLTARLKLASGTTDEFSRALQSVSQIADQYQQSINDIGGAYQRLAPAVQKLGMSQDDLRDILSAVSAGLKISGASADQASGFLQQFAQALNSSTVQAEEWNSIQDSNLALVNALEKQLPGLVNQYGSLKGAINAQAVTNDMLAKAVKGAAAELEQQASTMNATVSGALTVLNNAWEVYIGKADQSRGATRGISEALIELSKNLDIVLVPLGKFVDIEVGGLVALKDIIGEISKNLKEMVGLQDGGTFDPEIDRLMKAGSGQLSIGEIAGTKQIQDQQKEYFDGVKKSALEAALATMKLSEAQKEVARIVYETAKSQKVDPAFALAIAQQESGFNQLAKSAAGAQGVMQLMPKTAEYLKVKIGDLNENIQGGVKYLKELGDGGKSLSIVAASYNAGPGNVAKYGGVPPFNETRKYVDSVARLTDSWNQALGAQGQAFSSVKDQASEMSSAYDRLKAEQDTLTKSSESYAKLQVERIKTSLAQLEAERKATQDVTAAQVASATSYDEKQRIIAEAARQADAYSQRQIALLTQEFDAQQASIEARKQSLSAELDAAERYGVSINEQIKLNGDIKQADIDLAILAQNRAQAEIDAGAKSNQYAQQSADLKRQEAAFIGDTIAEYERQVEVLNRLTAAKEAGASADQLAMLNSYYGATGQLPELVSQEQLQRMSQYQLSILGVKEAIDQMTQSQKQNGEQDVREAAVRQMQVLSANMEYAQQTAAGLAKAFGDVGSAVGKVVVTMAEYAKQQAAISIEAEEQIKKNPAERYEIEMRAAEQSAQLQIKSYGDISDAASGFFKEGTKGYQAMQNATKVFRVFEMAMAVKSMVAQVVGNQTIRESDVARTGVETAQSTARGQAKAAEAIANQASGGDPYSAFPRVAAMAALMAAVGFAVMGATSGGSASGREQRQSSQGTGTVLGDTTAQSTSILDALDVIRDNSSNDLSYSAKMLKALQSIEAGLSGVANQIFTNVVPAVYDYAASMNIGSSQFGLLGRSSKKVTDWGLEGLPQKLSDILTKGFKGILWGEITREQRILGMKIGGSSEIRMTALDGNTESAITKTFRTMRDAIVEGGKVFGLSANDFVKRLNGFVVDFGKVSLKDLSGEDAQKQIAAILSKQSDLITKRFMPGLNAFQQLGEGYFTTFVRVGEGINRATGELERLGVEAINFRSIANKQGDVAAEIVRQSLLAQNGLVDGVRTYVDQLDGSAEDIIEAYKKLVTASSLLKTAGIGDANLDRTMINAAGGLDAFNDAMQAFNDNFLTDAQRYAGDVRDMADEFGKLGYILPDSKDAFRELVMGIDTSTEAGKKLFGHMISLADAFAKVSDEADRIREKYSNVLDPMASIRKQIEQVGSDFGKLITNAIAPIQQRGDKRITDLGRQAAVDDLMMVMENRDRLDAEIKRLKAEIAKKPSKKILAQLQKDLEYAEDQLRQTVAAIDGVNGMLANIDAQIRQIQGDTAEEIARAKAPLLDAAAQVMTETLADIFQSLEQTIREAQQRLQSVLDFQRNLASQIAQLQGPEAVAGLAGSRYTAAMGAISTYKAGLTDSSQRDTSYELQLLNDAQQAVMDKYNAELALIQEATQAQADALNEQLQAQIEAINEASQAQIDAVNAATESQIKGMQDALDASIKAQQKANEAAIKAQQKANEQVIKEQQKADEAAIKAQQKANEQIVKARQKQYDAEIKALQKRHEAQLDALQQELDAANKLKDAIKSVADYARSMLLGPQSTISPEARLAEAGRQYQDLLAASRRGDTDAIAQLSGASDAYLEAAKQYYGSSTQYQDIFDGVRQAMEQIGGMSAPDPDSIQARIDALREQQAEQLDALREVQQEDLDALRETQQEQLDAIRESQQAQIDAIREAQQEALDAIREAQQDSLQGMRDAAQAQMEATREAARQQIEAVQEAAQAQIEAAQQHTQQAIADLSDPNKNAAMKALKEATIAELQEVARLAELTRQEAARQAEEARRQAQEQAEEAVRMAQEQLRALDETARLNAAQLGALNAMLTNMGLQPVPAYARGGYAPAGLALVGEKGPELVRFERPAQVLTADDTRAALSGGNSEKVANAIAELKDEMRASVAVQSNAYPLLIEEIRQLRQRVEDMERQQRIKA